MVAAFGGVRSGAAPSWTYTALGMGNQRTHRARTVLLTGATGFIGQHLWPALEAAGHRVIGTSRSADRAREGQPAREWRSLDVEDPSTMAAALEGCDVVVYLVHGLRQGDDYPEREREAAFAFRDAAAEAGVKRVVYLGGVAPAGEASRHLKSRLSTGAVLRGGAVPCTELRAAMIIGQGSASWSITRDLARRLPAMLLPSWLRNRSHPVDVTDVVAALRWAVEQPDDVPSEWLDVPGPRCLTHEEMLRIAADEFGRHPPMLSVPVLSPRLSSYWIALVTRERLSMAKELVEGLRWDLLPAGESVWERCGHTPLPVEDSVKRAIADELEGTIPSPVTLARLKAIGRREAKAEAA